MPSTHEVHSDEAVSNQEQPSSNKGPARPGHSARYWLIFLVALFAAAAFVVSVGWLPRHKQAQEINRDAQRQAQELPRINVQRVERAPATSELMIPGTTLPYTEAFIYARASGYVSRRLVDIGDHVSAGQLLAVIDAPDLDRQVAQAQSAVEQSQASVAQPEAQLHLASVTWERWKVLVGRGVFSRQEGDQQEANYRVAEANLRAAQNTVQANRENLSRLLVLQQYEHVSAPFSGVITARNVDVGALISSSGSGLGSSPSPSNSGSTAAAIQGNNQGSSGNLSSNASPTTGGAQGGQMFSLASIGQLRVLVSVPEAYTNLIHRGQRAQLVFQERNRKVTGRVTRTSSSIDQNTRTLLVEVQVSNDGTLVPGMYALVNFIDVKGSPPLLIPGASIVIRDGKTNVATVENQIVHFRPISIGRDYGEQSELTDGLRQGDVVAVNVSDEVKEGIKIDPQFPKKAQPPQEGRQRDRSPGQGGQYGPPELSNSPQGTGKAGGKNSGSGSGHANPGKQ